jgi:chorismate mutase/prephenate dehydratase
MSGVKGGARMINSLRDKIDAIDIKLIELLKERMNIVKAVADYKIENNLTVNDPKREEEIISRTADSLKDFEYKDDILLLMKEIFNNSKNIQNRYINNESIGYQGTQGSYSEEMAMAYFGDNCNRMNYETFEDVFNALEENEITYGVLPIENSSTGAIKEVYDLLIKYGFNIAGEYNLKVDHHLIGIRGTNLDEIKEVYSHPQGIEQCNNFLSYYPSWQKINFLNTASSVKYVSQKQDKSIAAIGSKRAAQIYNLSILKENINDNKVNTTRFIVLKRKMEINDSHNKISLVFTTPHKAGALYDILGVFAKYKINMVKIESRPIKHQIGKYYFFVDIEGHLKAENVSKALAEINDNQSYFKILGNYRKTE